MRTCEHATPCELLLEHGSPMLNPCACPHFHDGNRRPGALPYLLRQVLSPGSARTPPAAAAWLQRRASLDEGVQVAAELGEEASVAWRSIAERQ